jgi:hypothetical protein
LFLKSTKLKLPLSKTFEAVHLKIVFTVVKQIVWLIFLKLRHLNKLEDIHCLDV